MFLSAPRLSPRTCMHHGINSRVLRFCVQQEIQLCVMRAARLKHICLILQMLRVSTSAVSNCQRPSVQWARAWSNAGSARSWFCGVGSGRQLLPSGEGDAQHQVKFDQIGPGHTKLRESKLIPTECQRVRPWTHTCHSQQSGMLGHLLLDLGGSLGPYRKPQRMQWIISLALVDHVILTLFRLICNLKLRIARRRGAVAPLAAVCFQRGVETRVLTPWAQI